MRTASLLFAFAGTSILSLACSDTRDVAPHDRTDLPATFDDAVACEPPSRAESLGLGSAKDIVWNGDGYGIIHQSLSGNVDSLVFERRDASGQILGAPVILDGTKPYDLKLVRAGTGYAAVAVSFEGTRLIRLDGNGQRLGEDVTIPRWIVAGVDLSFNGTEYYLTWTEAKDNGDGVYVARVDANGQRLGEATRIRHQREQAFSSRLAWSGSEHGIVWQDNRHRIPGDVYFARMNASGQQVGPEVRLTTNETTGSEGPTIVWAGDHYSVFYWSTAKELRFMQVSPSGELLANPVRVAGARRDPDIGAVWTGTRYGIAMNYEDNVRLLTADANGQQVGSNIDITIGGDRTFSPSLTTDGTGYRVMWKAFSGSGEGTASIHLGPLLCP